MLRVMVMDELQGMQRLQRMLEDPSSSMLRVMVMGELQGMEREQHHLAPEQEEWRLGLLWWR
jgi:hypothetical protein